MAELLKIKFEDIEKIELIGGYKAQTLAQAVAKYSRKPDYVFNAGHFDNSKKSETYGLTISDTIIDNKLINGGNYSSNIYTDTGIAFSENGKMVLCTTSKAQEQKYKYFIGGSPHIINDNEICTEKLNTNFGKQSTYRIGMGFDEKELIVCFPNRKITLNDLSENMKKLGAKNAIALDGGGSLNVCQYNGTSYMHIDDLKYNRAVSTYVCVWLKRKNTESTKIEIPTHDGQKAIGIVEIIWNTVNRRIGAGVGYALTGSLKKGDRVTIFEQKGSWGKSYGYWISLNSAKWVERY